ncbi:MAG: hypothetical protein J6Z30_02355 [Pyramidobacter sp.]|nr:hypothetical protein [Pyramidobacter sp.]
MIELFRQLCSFVIAHSLLLGAGAFMLLRGALSRSLSAAIVERISPPSAELPVSKRAYRGWKERLRRFVPDAIEDSVLREAYRQRVAEQVRREFLELVIACLFNLIIALGAYLTGWALTKTGLLTPSWLIFAVRLISLAIFVQTALRAWAGWDALSWKDVRAFYDEFGLNVVRLIEFQIAALVESQAALAIEANVKRLGRVERAAYRWLGLGTDYYARVVSRRALDENRGAIRWILAIGAASAASYYTVLLFLIAPLVRHETGESFFSYVFLDPVAAALRFAGAHPLFLSLCAAGALIVWRLRGRVLRLIARPVVAVLSFIEKRL